MIASNIPDNITPHAIGPDNQPSGQSTRSGIQRNSDARLHYILENLGLFFEAVHEHDPLPLLCDLTAELLDTHDVEIAIPSGISVSHGSDAYLLGQAIAIKGQPIGRLVVRRATPFSSEERALAFMIAQLVGVVVEQNSLQGQIVQYHQQVQANTETLDQLLNLKRQIVSGHLNPQEVSMRLTTHVQVMVGGERASLLIVSNDNCDSPQLFLSDGTVATTERACEVRDHGLAGMVLRERRPLIIDETDTDQRWVSMSLDTYEAPSRCAMAVPLIWGDKILGVLTVTTTRSHLFGTLHLGLLELIGHNVALALRSVSLHTRMQRLSAMMAEISTTLTTMLHHAASDGTLDYTHDIAANLECLNSVTDQLQHVRQELLDLQRFVAPDMCL